MNELQVVVKQQVGKINWNFEELKTALAAEMEKYTGIVYDDDSIADAKNTVAYLRSSSAFIEIESGNTYSAPPEDGGLNKESYWRK